MNKILKFIFVVLIIGLITYIHHILRITRDVLIISHLGSETISITDLCIGLPLSLCLMVTYIKLADKFTRSKLFHFVTWFLISYFVLFAFILYPHRDALTIPINQNLIASLPKLKYFFRMIANWHYCLFLIFSECWMIIMIPISFWQTLNHITTLEESKKIYPLLGLMAQIGMLFAGISSKILIASGTNWQPTLNKVTISIVIAGIALSYCLIGLKHVVGPVFFDAKHGHFKSKNNISLKESFKYILSSKHIMFITIILFCCNLGGVISDGVWKKSIEVLLAGNANLIHNFISNVSICISLCSAFSAFIGIYILRKFSWKFLALITPVTFLVIGGIFFLTTTMYNYEILPTIITLSATVYLGAIGDTLTKASKYTIFDPSKEMVYIPLDDDLQTKGKAAAETLGSRFGRSGGALVQQMLLSIFPSLTLINLAPIIGLIFIAVMIFWIINTCRLSSILR